MSLWSAHLLRGGILRIRSSSSHSTSHASMRGLSCYQLIRVRILYACTHVRTS
ncbi:hypothetical protein Ahy_A01g004285 isoform A [Arachis hypogaea]|uniref:Uncharacterized protein n=1 Tax=Arachis hypogaea TaxID=3818 RepID=A0A445EVN2_ARAHY|nr:hypothetical protein Ahy_A01g004285 isoform A [Arachis hypogaea]